ncbi:MAG: PHP domain-containing protein [Clostridia bacterium]|nr:PHP domain-containing protein [Clostridia bacterium]
MDGNINIDSEASFEEKIEFYFSDFEEGKKHGKDIELDVFCGIEMSYKGTDFLIYGLDKKWWLERPEIMLMKKSDQLPVLAANGALVIQAHPFRNASYLDHIRLFPDQVHGTEVVNSCNDELANKMAKIYAENYGLLPFAGSDNHIGSRKTSLSGVETFRPVKDEKDFVDTILSKEYKIFSE